MKRIFAIFLCFVLLSSPIFAMGSKEAGATAGAIAGGAGGTVAGAGIGAGVGAVVGSIVPGAGTVIGATLGAKIGGLFGALVGSVGGGFVGHDISGSGSEYVYVDTNFVIAQAGEERFMTSVTDNATLNQNYNVPEFSFEKDLYLTIEMRPSLIDEIANRVSNNMKSKDVIIPVTVIINNSESIEVTNSGGLYIEDLATDVEGTSFASFSINLDPDRTYPVTFKISPAKVGTSRFTVIYGTDENKLVSFNCNRTFLIEFVESENE